MDDKTIPGSSDGFAFEDAPTIAPGSWKKSIKIGDVLCNRYEVRAKLGQGGMGVVYQCYDRESNLDVALKTIAPELARDEEAMNATRENFRIVHQLHHEYIAAYNTLEHDPVRGIYYVIMEYVNGKNIRAYLQEKRKEGKFDSELLRLVRQAAHALDYAHGKKVVHRDIKPANIMVDSDGNLKLLDFGLAAKIHTTMTMTIPRKKEEDDADTSGGTLLYMSPEQLAGKRDKPAMDQYSLAATVYELVSGTPVFCAPNEWALYRCIEEKLPEPLEEVSPEFSAAVLKALSKNPKDRFASCIEFAEALEGKSIPVPEPVSEENPAKKSKKNVPVSSRKLKNYKKLLIFILLLFIITGGIIAVVKYTSYKPTILTISLPGDVKLEMVKLPDETYIGKYEITQGQWEAVMKTSIHDMEKKKVYGSLTGVGSRYPMYFVSWKDAKDFCTKLNEGGYAPSGYKFTLPTEAQWEYACRAGTETELNNGTDLTPRRKMCPNLDKVAWYSQNSNDTAHPVGGKEPNAWGLYDMHGNIKEWCENRFQESEFQMKNGVSYKVKEKSRTRAIRGGSWYDNKTYCSSTERSEGNPDVRSSGIGFRIALYPVMDDDGFFLDPVD